MENPNIKAVQTALKCLENHVAFISPRLKERHSLDVTHLIEIEVLCTNCSNHYFRGLPLAQETMKLLLTKARKTHQILDELYRNVQKGRDETRHLLSYRDDLYRYMMQLKRISATFKREEKHVYVVTNSLVQPADKVTGNEMSVEDIQIESAKAERPDLEIPNNHPRIWDYVPDNRDYIESYP